MQQFKAAQTAVRDEFNPVMSAGNLTQQWIVDSYLQVEANNLNYVRQHQFKIRAENYKNLTDHLANLAENLGEGHQAGVSVILPSSFQGSPRNMREKCCNAMSIFSKFRAPDLFITFTANPNWPEITENLKQGETTSDRPDLAARVFKIKLDSLIADLTKHHVLGRVTAHVYTIEFQKRGLPHAHILATLRAEDKFTTAQRIDQTVCAEIPIESENPRLCEIILRCVMHGPCGIHNPHAPCMVEGKCSKMFPKEFNETTQPNVEGYPKYRRRPGVTAVVRNVTMDNRSVVPYNPYLTLKYNAHINVEVCTSLQAIKYIYKYIYKGYDCANIAVTTNGDTVLGFDEISNYIDCRYVSAPEAMWRLLENEMHQRSHTVQRLPVHLPEQQRVIFEEGYEQDALNKAGNTKLEKWFELNGKDDSAKEYLYTEIPLHYVWLNHQWKKRERGGDKAVARMYTVGPRDEERFYLRMMLLHVRGATSFECLRTVDGTVHDTFKNCALARGMIESDKEWFRCLEEAAIYQLPPQLRETFAFICCFCQPAKPIKLWEEHKNDMILDFLRR